MISKKRRLNIRTVLKSKRPGLLTRNLFPSDNAIYSYIKNHITNLLKYLVRKKENYNLKNILITLFPIKYLVYHNENFIINGIDNGFFLFVEIDANKSNLGLLISEYYVFDVYAYTVSSEHLPNIYFSNIKDAIKCKELNKGSQLHGYYRVLNVDTSPFNRNDTIDFLSIPITYSNTFYRTGKHIKLIPLLDY
jgi:hypothetical protein